jgi:hypothetical protein
MSRGLLLLVFIAYWSLTATGQSAVLDYAHYVIDTLTSPAIDGRGYVDSSDYKAARFIRNEFEKMMLKPLSENYFQTFTLSANTFPAEMKVKYDGKKLIPGQDFLVDAASSGLKGKLKVVPVIKENKQDTSVLAGPDALKKLQHVENKQVLLSYNRNDWTKQQLKVLRDMLNGTSAFTTKGIIESDTGKLTWDAAHDTIPFLRLQLRHAQPVKDTKIKVDIDATYKRNYLSRNVMAFIPGSVSSDTFIVFTAHYDHLGQMGDGTYFPGANDNASGTSMVLNLAGYYSQHPQKYNVAFICFSGEELGLLGSSYFVDHPVFPLSKIKFLINLDIVGTGEDGIKVVNATEFPKQFDQLVKLNTEKQYVKQVLPRGKAANSDHYPFYEKGVPCFFIYTLGGIAAYHDIYDRAETLPLTEYEDLFRLLVEFAGDL